MASWWKRRYALREVQFHDDLFTDPLVFQCISTTHAKTSVRLLSQVQIWCRQENLLVQETSKKHVAIKHEISENCHKALKSYKFVQHFEVLYFLIVFQTVCESLSPFVTNMIMLLFFSLSRRSFIPHYWR